MFDNSHMGFNEPLIAIIIHAVFTSMLLICYLIGIAVLGQVSTPF